MRLTSITAVTCVALLLSLSSVARAADLTIGMTGVEINPTTGGSDTVTITVSLTGTALPAGGYVDVRLYLSSNSQYDAGDIQLWASNNSTPDFSTNTINGATYQSRDATFSYPSTTGSHYLIAVVDRPAGYGTNGYFTETNENNNATNRVITFPAPLLAPPTITAPTAGSTLYASTVPALVTISFTQPNGSAGVELQVDGLQVLINDGTRTSYDATLSGFGAHNVRGRTKNSSGAYGSWSNYVNFTLAQGSLPPPTITSPANNATLSVASLPAQVRIEFAQPNGSAGVELQVDGLQVLLNDGSRTSYDATLSSAGSHNVRGRAKNASGVYGNWSGYTNFTLQITTPPDLTTSATGIPATLDSGATFQANVTLTRTGGDLTLGAYAAAGLYLSQDNVFQAASDTLLWFSNNGASPDYPNTLLNGGSSKQLTRTATSTAIPETAGTFYVLAVADPDNFHSGETNELNNTHATLVKIRPRAPVLSSPVSSAVVNAGSVPFSWSSVNGAARFKLKIATDSALSQEISGSPFQPQPGVTSHSQTLPAGTYYWQVASIGADETVGWGPWSISRALTVQVPPQARTISGTVRDLGGSGLAGVVVKAYQGGVLKAQGTTIANGSYVVSSQIFNQIYVVKAELAGRIFNEPTVDVRYGDASGQDFAETQPNPPTIAFTATTASLFLATYQATPGQPKGIAVAVTSHRALTSVQIRYRTIGGVFTTQSMVAAGGNQWQFDVPGGVFTQPGVEVQVVANDGLSASTPVQQINVANIPPFVAIVGVSSPQAPPITVLTGNSHTVRAVITDQDNNTITGATLTFALGNAVPTQLPMTLNGATGQWEATILAAHIREGTRTWYRVRATDDRGGSAETQPLSINRNVEQTGKSPYSYPVADPINASNGNYLYGRRLLELLGRGGPHSFDLSYNSLAPLDSALGWGWTHGYAMRLALYADGLVEVLMDDGDTDRYAEVTPGVYRGLEPSNLASLTRNASGYLLIERSTRKLTFDLEGRLLQVDLPGGYRITLAYASGRLSAVSLPSGHSYMFVYAVDGRISEVQDSTGRSAVFGRDQAGNLSSITDPRGKATLFEYDGFHRVKKITLPRGNVLLSNVFDSLGRVVEQRDGRGSLWRLAYGMKGLVQTDGWTTITNPDLNATTLEVRHGSQEEWLDLVREDRQPLHVTFNAQGLPSSIFDPDQNETVLSYDSQSNLQSVTHLPTGASSSVTYDANNQPIRVVDPGTVATDILRDAQGRVTQMTDPLGSEGMTFDANGDAIGATDRLGQSSQIVPDSAGNVLRLRDPSGVEVTLVRNAQGYPTQQADASGAVSITRDLEGRVVRLVDALNRATDVTWDDNGNLRAVSNAAGTTQFTYDDNDALAEVASPDGGRVVYTRDPLSRVSSVADAMGNGSAFERDAMGRVTKITSTEGRVITFAYNNRGDLVSRTDSAGTTTFQRDTRGQLTGVTNPLNESWQFVRDARGLVTTAVDPLGRRTEYRQDATRRLIEVVDARNVSSFYTRNARDLTETKAPSGAATALAHDQAGRLVSRTDPNGRAWTYQFGADGRLAAVGAPSGATTALTHDASGALTAISAGGETVSFGHDGAGRLTTTTTPRGSSTRTLDGVGRILERVDEFGLRVQVTYDLAGRPTRLTYPNGFFVLSRYDRDGLLREIEDSSGRITAFVHDQRRLLSRVTLPNGVVSTIGRDPVGRVLSLRHTAPGGAVIAEWTITLNPLGNRTRIASQTGGLAWTLPQGTSSFTADPADQLVSGPVSLQNDAEGRLVTWGSQTLGYDGLGRLTSMSGAGGSTTNRYDGDGELISIVRNGVETRLIQDLSAGMSRLLVEANGSSQPQALYVYGLSLAYRVDVGTSAVRYFLADPNGNVVALADETGAVTDRYAYTPYGETVATQGATANPFRFGGAFGVYDPSDGILIMRRRVYVPSICRFTTPDPVEQPLEGPQARNLYSYALGNPWGFVDPAGLTGQRDTSAGTQGQHSSHGSTVSARDFAQQEFSVLSATPNVGPEQDTFFDIGKAETQVGQVLGDTAEGVLIEALADAAPVAGFAVEWANNTRKLASETLNTMALIHNAEAGLFENSVEFLYDQGYTVRNVVDMIASPAGYGIPGINKINIQNAVLDFIRVNGIAITPEQFEDRYTPVVTWWGGLRAR